MGRVVAGILGMLLGPFLWIGLYALWDRYYGPKLGYLMDDDDEVIQKAGNKDE